MGSHGAPWGDELFCPTLGCSILCARPTAPHVPPRSFSRAQCTHVGAHGVGGGGNLQALQRIPRHPPCCGCTTRGHGAGSVLGSCGPQMCAKSRRQRLVWDGGNPGWGWSSVPRVPHALTHSNTQHAGIPTPAPSSAPLGATPGMWAAHPQPCIPLSSYQEGPHGCPSPAAPRHCRNHHTVCFWLGDASTAAVPRTRSLVLVCLGLPPAIPQLP